MKPWGKATHQGRGCTNFSTRVSGNISRSAEHNEPQQTAHAQTSKPFDVCSLKPHLTVKYSFYVARTHFHHALSGAISISIIPHMQRNKRFVRHDLASRGPSTLPSARTKRPPQETPPDRTSSADPLHQRTAVVHNQARVARNTRQRSSPQLLHPAQPTESRDAYTKKETASKKQPLLC